MFTILSEYKVTELTEWVAEGGNESGQVNEDALE